jgi:hypothetical protein
MNTPTKTIQRLLVTAVALSLSWPCAAEPRYQTRLDAKAIEEAYALGQRNDGVTADFVARYIGQSTEEGQDGLHRAEIELLTPFLQIVDRARDNSKGYSLEQAKLDYQTRGDSILIRISLMLPANYPAPNNSAQEACDNTELLPQNFWNNFAFIVKQHSKTVEARSVKNEPVYSAPSNDRPSRLDGANVTLEFDSKNIASEPLTVDIITPRCKTITATFDLAILR